METIKFDKLNIEIEIKTDEASLLEIKELRDRIRVFFEDKICYAGRVVAFNDVFVEARGAARAEAR